MECPICFETKHNNYNFKGCTHSVCNKCYNKMKNQSLQNKNLNDFFKFIPNKYSICLSCPLCRAIEPTLDINYLQKKYSKEYNMYIEHTFNQGYIIIKHNIIVYPTLKTKFYNTKTNYK